MGTEWIENLYAKLKGGQKKGEEKCENKIKECKLSMVKIVKKVSTKENETLLFFFLQIDGLEL